MTASVQCISQKYIFGKCASSKVLFWSKSKRTLKVMPQLPEPHDCKDCQYQQERGILGSEVEKWFLIIKVAGCVRLIYKSDKECHSIDTLAIYP